MRKGPWAPAARFGSPLWSGLVPALIALAGLVILDSRQNLEIIGFFALVPFTTALGGNLRTTVVVTLMTIVVVGASGLWNHNYDTGDYWVRSGLVVAGSLFSCYVAAIIARGNRTTSRIELLNAVAAGSEERPTLAATLERVTDLIVPAVADICVIDSISGERLERIAVRAAGPRREEVEAGLMSRRPSVAPEVAFGDAAGEPVVNRVVSEGELEALSQSTEDRAFIHSLGVRSYMAVALRSRGRRIGALTLAQTGSGRRFDDDAVSFARVLADRFALSLDNAGLFSDLESVEMRMDAVMAVLDEPVTITERGGRLVFANEAAVALAGRGSLEELLVDDSGGGFDIFDERGALLGRATLPWRLGGGEHELLRLVDPADGTESWLRARSRVMSTADERPIYTVTSFEDVTEMKLAEFTQSAFASTAELLGTSTDPQLMLQRLVALLIPQLADACSVLTPDRDGLLTLAALADIDPAREASLHDLVAANPLDPEGMGMAEMLRALAPVVYDTTRPDDWPGAAVEIAGGLRASGLGAVMAQPLRVGGRLIGVIGFANHVQRGGFTPLEQRVALRIADRVALALDNARVASRRSEIAATLQSGLRPPDLPSVPGWALAGLYTPAGAENEAGGDFYDLLPIERGWMAVIGDVTGHGARAASLTALARYTLRTAAALTGDPARTLAVLNDALLQRADGALCSVVLLALDRPAPGAIGVAIAGHPPPLILHRGATSAIRPAGPVLGAFDDASWEVETVSLARGDQLLVYTDGVVEARGRGGRFGEERLCRCLDDVDGPADTIGRIRAELDRFAAGELDDDAAALAVMRSGADGPDRGGGAAGRPAARLGLGVSMP